MDRIATFTSFIEQSPDDPFPRYGLAMEHRKQGDLEQAQTVFDELQRKFPEYVALYLMSGNNLHSLGRTEDAAAMYRSGIEVCGRVGNSHAKGELAEALAELGDSA